jgi:hypothetical protein
MLRFHNFLVLKYPGCSKSEINPGCVMKVGFIPWQHKTELLGRNLRRLA